MKTTSMVPKSYKSEITRYQWYSV